MSCINHLVDLCHVLDLHASIDDKTAQMVPSWLSLQRGKSPRDNLNHGPTTSIIYIEQRDLFLSVDY